MSCLVKTYEGHARDVAKLSHKDRHLLGKVPSDAPSCLPLRFAT